MRETKLCAVCGRLIEREPGTRIDTWERRRCCSKSCGGKLGNSRSSKLNEQGAGMKAKSWTIAQNHKLAKRLAKLPRKDFETTDQALARGVRITRCEPAYAYPSDHMPNGSPVRPAMEKGRRAS